MTVSGATKAIAPDEVAGLVRGVRQGAGLLRACSHEQLDRALHALHDGWSANGFYRDRFLASAPEHEIGLSRPMIEWALDRFVTRLHPAAASARRTLQLSNTRRSTEAVFRPEPLGVLLLVVSGNTFTGPVEAMLAALATRNAVIVKRPSSGGAFVDLFVESLEDTSPELTAAVARASWTGGTVAIERPLADEVDGIVVAGDSDTLAAYRRLAPPTTPLVEFGPRVSIAVVSARGLGDLDIDGLARDVAMWDQQACSAAQAVYVQGEDAALDTAERLSGALERLERSMPGGNASLDERVEVSRLRHEAAFAEAQGRARVFPVAGALATVVFERDATFQPTPLRRTVHVEPYGRIDDLVPALSPARQLLSTVGLAVAAHERQDYEDLLAAAGARRVCGIGRMNEPAAEGSHDGMLELQRLVRWVECAR